MAESLQVNADDLAESGGHSDQAAADVADIVRQNAAVLVAVVRDLLNELDEVITESEFERYGREPVDSAHSPIQPSGERRAAADRLRKHLNDFLREEPSLEDDARQQASDSSSERERRTPDSN